MWRVWTVFILICVLFGVILARLFYWQVLHADSLSLAAASQYSLELALPAGRGSIYSSDNSPLVLNQPAYLVYAEPRFIKDPQSFSRKVSEALSRDAADVFALISEPGRAWVPLEHKVEAGVADTLKALDLTGLGMEKEPKRYYPEASMAAHLLGFVGSDDKGLDKGYFGLEGYYDRELRGKDGAIRIEKDAKGAPILIGESRRIPPTNGRSLRLYTDRTAQRIVEKKLLEGIAKYGAKEGSVVVMDPKTGGILASASYPSYDPLSYSRFSQDLYSNPVVSRSYEPGSTFKVLVMAAAIDAKAVTPATTMNESGPVQVGDYSIRTWNNEYHGPVTMTKVLERSSNVGMVYVGQELGREKLLSSIREFGIGELTHVDVEEESAPQLRPDKEWRDIDLATASFGQGIAVTPLQMVRAVGALANDGWLMEPRIVREMVDETGKVVTIKPKRVRQVVSPATSRIIAEMMVAAVDNGEAKWAKPVGYRIAGKTGTAQIPVAGHYDEEKTIASFVGFAPADNPRFVMLVTLREPQSSPWGSETAAPLFFAIARDLFAYWGIAPQ